MSSKLSNSDTRTEWLDALRLIEVSMLELASLECVPNVRKCLVRDLKILFLLYRVFRVFEFPSIRIWSRTSFLLYSGRVNMDRLVHSQT